MSGLGIDGNTPGEDLVFAALASDGDEAVTLQGLGQRLGDLHREPASERPDVNTVVD